MLRCALLVFLAIGIVFPTSAQQSKRKRRSAPTSKPPATKPKVVIQPQISEEERKQLAESASQSRTNLIAASKSYRESLEKVLELQKQDETRAADLVEKRKALLDLGVVSKKDVEEGEQSLTATRTRISETEKQMEQVDQLVAEVNAAEELAKMPKALPGSYGSSGILLRYVGSSRWALGDFGKVEAFFRLKFGRPLPVSALGQTDTHNRLGLDHHEAIDVAVHPDSAEGQALIDYLRSQGISFIAIRSPIPGSATGAHIHIGPESKRIVAH